MGSCNKEEQRRLGSLVKNTVMLLSKDGITYQKNITIQGVLGITVDDKDVFIIHINETIQHPDTIPDESQMSTKRSHTGHRRAAKRRRSSHSFSSDSGSGTVEEAGNNCSDTPHIHSDRPRQVEAEASVTHDNTSEPMVSLPHHAQTSQSANVIVIGPEAPVKQEPFEPNFIVDNELSFAMRSVPSSLDSTTLGNEALLNTPTTHNQPLNITTTYNQPLNITPKYNQPLIATAFSQPFITGLVPNKSMLTTEGPSSTSTNPSVSSAKPSLRSIKPKTRSNQPSSSPMAPSASSTTPSITRHTGQPGKSNTECGRDDQLHLKERMGEEEYKGPENADQSGDTSTPESLERFPAVRTEDIDILETQRAQGENKESRKTRITVQSSVNLFKSWLLARHLDFQEVEEGSIELLDSTLKQFYAEARRGDGQLYSLMSYKTNRYGLQRYFMEKRNINISKGDEFKSSNATFNAMRLKLMNEGTTNHMVPVSVEDWRRLHQRGLLNLDKPETLQNKVFIDIMLFIRNRNMLRGNLRVLTKSNFQISRHWNGQRYVHLVDDSVTKEHQTGMCEDGTHLCPVASFEKYLSKLDPHCESLFQKPKSIKKLLKTRSVSSSPLWYEAIAVGQNTLSVKMKDLSIAAGLGVMYTNISLKMSSGAKNWSEVFKGCIPCSGIKKEITIW